MSIDKQTGLLETFNRMIKKLVEHNVHKKDIAFTLGYKGGAHGGVDSLNKVERGEGATIEKLTKFIELLENKSDYKLILVPSSFDILESNLVYFMYYWSNRKQIGLSIISIALNKDGTLNSDGSELIYVKRNLEGRFEIIKTRKIESYTLVPHKVLEIISHKKLGAPRTFITADIAGGDIEELNFAYCSYCGSMSSNKGAYAGIGILEKIDPKTIKQRLRIDADNFAEPILNALYERRLNVGHSEIGLYDKVDEIRNKQTRAIKSIAGFWVGFYPRKHIDQNGGLAKVIAYISTSGEVHIHYKMPTELEDIHPDYTGIIKFPYSKSNTIIVGELEYYKGTHRIRLLLNYHNKKITGNMSGWRDEDGSIFSRVVLLESIDAVGSYQENIATILKAHQPRGYTIQELMTYASQVRTLNKLEDQFLHTMETCIVGSARKTVTQLDLFLNQTER